MSKIYTLVVLDVSGIQRYVFNSNVLAHSLGASELVHAATHKWVREALPVPNNYSADDVIDGDKRIEDGELAAEVVYVGGGNAVIVFADKCEAIKFNKGLSSKVLKEAAGLNLVIALREFDWDSSIEPLGKVVSSVLAFDVQRKKNAGVADGGLLGLGVTAACDFTGLPAIKKDDDGRRISSEVACKLKAAPTANKRLDDIKCSYLFLYDFNKIGDHGTFSYMAVVHADGNGMGDRFKVPGNAHLGSREYVARVRALSNSVNDASKNALKATAYAMENAIEEVEIKGKKGVFEKRIGGVVRLIEKERQLHLPFRPIIFGGDDVTFVCDGRLGISAAEKYLEAFSRQSLSEGPNATARAGIAIVKTHFPFAQAYQLAEALAKNAKQRLKDIEQRERRKDISTLDWHIATNGLVMNLEAIRRRDYSLPGGNDVLHMRPLRMDESDTDRRNRCQFGSVWSMLHTKSEEARGKVKTLHAVLRKGQNATSEFLKLHEKEFGELRQVVGDGWAGGHSLVFDAVEAQEFYVPLTEAK